MEPLGITCNNCGRFVAYKACVSDANGNKGRLVAVCNGSNAKGEKCSTIRWKKGSSASPSSSPPLNSQPPLLPVPLQVPTPTGLTPAVTNTMGGSVFATAAPPGIPHCRIHGCGQSRIAPDCQKRLCRKHCISSPGSCSSKTHVRPRPAAQAMSPVASIQPGRVRAPTPPLLLPSAMTTGPSNAQVVRVDSPSNLNTNTRLSPDSDILDALPNPRFRSHMPPIFTTQWRKEQELGEEQRRADSERKLCAAQVKHAVVVYAWVEDAKPATIEEFQEGPFAFTWPYFPLSAAVLSAFSLTGSTTRVQLYREALGTWVSINIGHVVELKQGARVFLKASHVVDYPDFDKLLKPESAPHIRYKLTEERRDLRNRYKSKMKDSGKGKAVQYMSSSDDECSDSPNKPARSQRQFRKQTLPPSFLRPTPSPNCVQPDIIELSSDDSSSGPAQLAKKRQASNQGSPLAPERRKKSRRPHVAIIELTDESDSSPPPSMQAAIKVEPATSDAVTVARQWPADFYALDIINFFAACEKNPTVRTETLFGDHFANIAYRRSTVNENRLRWRNAPQSLRDSVLSAERTDEGKWSVFQRSTRKSAKV